MLEVRLLGQFEVLQGGKRLAISTRNAQSLFAYLILNAGKAIRREKLAGLLWPDSSEENARSNLRHELWRLRKALEPGADEYFLVDDLSIAFNPQNDFSLDVHRLESGSIENDSAEELMAALSAYQGELLPGFYEEWARVERDRLSILVEAKVARLLEILQGQGRWAEVQDWATRWITLGQWPEPAYRAMMTAYANSGDLSKAATTYERFSQGLQKELGVKPSEQTQAVYKRIKTGWKVDVPVQASVRGAPPPKPLPDKSAASFALPRVRRTNLPRPLTSFIGREKEIKQVEELVARSRLVTITGSGGVGKTRLAIQTAQALMPQFPAGVWWAELAPISAPPALLNNGSTQTQGSAISQRGVREPPGFDLVIQAGAKALRVPEAPGQPLLEGILENLQDKQLLLVLDNCEHLIEACAVFVERILGECAQVTILATSREALGVPGEKAWYLPSLSLPWRWHSQDVRTILQSEAASLFIERAGDILPGYQPGEEEMPVIAQICLRLDGIPLAIELAAARMNLLSPQEIAARLDSRFSLLTSGRRTNLPRHQTLQATIEWSYDLLTEAEQVLLRRLSIFAGSFTMEGGEAVCPGEGIRRDDMLTLIGRLVDKSLLQVEQTRQYIDLPTRYRFQDTLRSFGHIKLDAADETPRMRDRHAVYYVRLVEAAEPELLLQNQARWFKLLQAENDNLREAIEWSADSGQPESALRLVGALLWFWFSYGSTHEGCDLALKALSSPSSVQFKETRARALNTAGFLLYLLGDTGLARQSLEEAISILRESNDEASLAWSLQFMGLVFTNDWEYELADAAFNEGLAFTRIPGAVNVNSFLHFRGDIELQKGDRSRAKKIYEESVNQLRMTGNKSFLAYPLRRLGYMALEQNDVPAAQNYFRESLAVNVDVGDKRAIAACLAGLASLSLSLGKPILAVQLMGTAMSQLESLSVNLLYLDQIELGRISSRLTTLLDETAFTKAFNEGWELSEEGAIEMAKGISDP